ncbi:acyl-CoA dehydrogenase [Inquilinus sp. CAU 1745]|uniref:acyl-CoA dehydrogenase n=1 Tax=Inquilinus sp. CAU 1745 TaxID=3140369 RepID=UPI00325C1383
MTSYAAPIQEMRFVLSRLVGLDRLAELPGYEEATPELVDAILEEAGKLASGVLAPLNHSGDRERSVLENGIVRTPKGFKEAYAAYREGGWNSVPFSPDHGGQGLPWTVGMAIQEMWHSANMAFGLCPTLNQSAVELLEAHGTPEQQRTYLEKLISGEWTGTMNLTEPQAGSDVGAVRTKATRQDDGSYRIVGQKIFITYGEHDLTENIIHMVLARTPGAPDGIKGISLFIVPKLLVAEDGTPGARNDLRCAGLEHKLGIHASPTCVMAFGDNGGATGYLVGEENRGIEYMFTMMNNARLSVGLQGVAIAERAYQQARGYARDRIQGRDMATGKEGARIIQHPDVRRMLMDMKAQTEAARALTYHAAAALDRARRHPDAGERRRAQALVDLLTPVVKAWSTDVGCEVSSAGVQIHGGMGYIEETGAAQHFRDARIAPIYEGTNGIQANDLMFRKVARDGGAAAKAFIGEMNNFDELLVEESGDRLTAIRRRLAEAVKTLNEATDHILRTVVTDQISVAAVATPYLRMFGIVAGGYMMARSALAAAEALEDGEGDPSFLEAKLVTAQHYADQILPQARGLLTPIIDGPRTIMALAEDQF